MWPTAGRLRCSQAASTMDAVRLSGSQHSSHEGLTPNINSIHLAFSPWCALHVRVYLRHAQQFCSAGRFKQSICAVHSALHSRQHNSRVGLHCRCTVANACTQRNEQARNQGLTFDAATVVTATQDAEVYKLVNSELEALQHLLVDILLDGQLGRLCTTQVLDEPHCGTCPYVHILYGFAYTCI